VVALQLLVRRVGEYVTLFQRKADMLTQGLDFEDMGDTTKREMDLSSGESSYRKLLRGLCHHGDDHCSL
jgi:hypothetical protein